MSAYDPRMPDLYQLVHMLVEPREGQKWIWEAEWHNSKDESQDLQLPT